MSHNKLSPININFLSKKQGLAMNFKTSVQLIQVGICFHLSHPSPKNINFMNSFCSLEYSHFKETVADDDKMSFGF